MLVTVRAKFTFDYVMAMSLSGSLCFLLFIAITGLPELTASSNHNHGLFSNSNAAPGQFEVSQLFKSKDMAGDAKSSVGSFLVNEDYIDTDNHCEFCTRVEFTPGTQGVAGMAYMDDKGHDLLGAKRITFYVLGVQGDANVKFMIAGKKLDQTKDGLSLNQRIFNKEKFGVATKTISLEKNWKKLEVDVSKIDLTNITHPFALKITKAAGSGKVVFYLKYIIFDEQNAKNPLPADNNSTN
jgi:hypothetical protein